MKKLIPMIAVAASVASAFADVGPKDTFTGMSGTFGSSDYWCAEGVEANVVASGIEARGNVLEIVDAPTTPLKRWYNANTAHNDEGATAQPIPTTGLYFDSMVKFTISEEIDQQIDPLAKIAVFACCNNGEGETNLVARAAYFGETTVATNYILKTGVDINWADWHRLTIKAIPYAEGKDGFVVYLDENLCSYDGDAGNIGPVTGVAAKYYGTTKSLLPSLITGGSTLGKLTQVGFVGTGSLDDVDFTDVAPSFAQDALTITITKTEGVEKVIVNNTEVQFVNDSYSLELRPGTKTIAISAVAEEGYALSWTGSDTFDVEGITQIDVTAFAVAFTVDGVPYAADNLTAALEAANGKTLKLAKDLDQAIELNEGAVILDLAGNDIVATAAEVTIYVSGTLIITNSTPQVGTIHPSNGVAICNEGTVEIYGGKIAGAIFETATFFGGSVIKGEESAFPYTLGDPEALEAKEVEGYWVIGPKEAEKTPLQIFLAAIYEAEADVETEVALTDDLVLEGKVAIAGGKKIVIVAEEAKKITGQLRVESGSSLTIGENVTVTSTGNPTVIVRGETAKATLVVNGTVLNTNEDLDQAYAICGSGNDATYGADITINGTVKNTNGVAIYVPQAGTFTVNDGALIEGITGAWVKSGAVVVTGGTFKGTYESATTPEVNNNGTTGGYGYGLIVETTTTAGGYADNVTINITGGSFQGPVAIYNFVRPETDPVAAGITGGTFSSEPAKALIVAGYEATEKDGVWTVAEKQEDEPTIPEEEGKIEKDQEGNYVVTPAEGTNTVDITKLPANATVIVPGSIDKINGLTEGATVIVKNGGYDITAACTITDGVITLNSEAIVEVDTEKIPVKPTIAEEVVVGGETVAPFNGTDTIAVKAIPGLKYTLVAGDEPGAVATPASEPVTATGTGVKLENTKFTAKGAKAFFKVQVSK